MLYKRLCVVELAWQYENFVALARASCSLIVAFFAAFFGSAPADIAFGLFLFGEGLGVWFVCSVCIEVAFEVSEREQSGDLAGVGVGDGGRVEDDDADFFPACDSEDCWVTVFHIHANDSRLLFLMYRMSVLFVNSLCNENCSQLNGVLRVLHASCDRLRVVLTAFFLNDDVEWLVCPNALVDLYALLDVDLELRLRFQLRTRPLQTKLFL